ncbi:MAG: hypothetical protein MK078_16665 [Crocinitomicaceae bacterium]|nr:hypothetical protein [Crocinitomicaceae bacterium]
MKYLFLFGLSILLFACGNSKGSADSTTTSTETTEDKDNGAETIEEGGTITAQVVSVVGVVHVSETGCPLYIAAEAGDEKLTLYPVNLEDKFKNEGMKLKFKYQPSKIQQPDACPDAMPVTLSDVSLMR